MWTAENEVAAEFQKIHDHSGIVVNAPIGALAHLGLGRACAPSGDKAKARSAWQDLLTFGKTPTPTFQC
jgi:eukaryotic-like serine/threonine-protein kinase